MISMFETLRARLLARFADALAPLIAARIEEEIGARLRNRTLRDIERSQLGLVAEEVKRRETQIKQIFPPTAYPSRWQHQRQR